MANSAPALPAGQLTLQQAFSPGPSSSSVPPQASDGPTKTTDVGANAGASESNVEYGPVIAAALQRKRGSQVPITGQPNAEEDTAQMPVQQSTERQQPGMQPTAVQYSIASGTATPTAPEDAVPRGGSYGKARKSVESSSAGSENRTGVDEPMGVSETALVIWQPSERRSDLLARLKNENDRKAELARKRASD